MHVVRNVCVCGVCTQCMIIATDVEPIHPANQMASWARGSGIELHPILATAAPCIYLSLAIANKELHILEPYPWFHSVQKRYLAWSRLACMLRSRCLPPSPRSAPSSKLSPLYVPMSPVSRAERCKPCPVALVPTLGCSRPLPPSLLLLASAVRKYNTGTCLFVQVKMVLTFGHV